MARDAVIRHLRIFVHFPSDTVAAQRANRGKTAAFYILLNGMTDVADAVSFARYLERLEETFFCNVDQTLSFFTDLADRRSKRAVGLPATFSNTERRSKSSFVTSLHLLSVF